MEHFNTRSDLVPSDDQVDAGFGDTPNLICVTHVFRKLMDVQVSREHVYLLRYFLNGANLI